MTIEEAIEHAEERACGNDQCAKDHAQLADWLRELMRARMEIDLLKTLRDGFKADAQMYMAENASLRGAVQGLGELCDKYKAENAKLRELVAHYECAVTVHDVKPVEVLEWSIRCDALRKELGIEGDE